MIDGGDGNGWCVVCEEGQDGYPCLHEAADVKEALVREQAQRKALEEQLAAAQRKIENLRSWPKRHGIPALRAAQTGWNDCRARVDEAVEAAAAEGLLIDA